jgi:hypothetical protein
MEAEPKGAEWRPSDDFQDLVGKCVLTPAFDSSTVKTERHVNCTTQVHVP